MGYISHYTMPMNIILRRCTVAITVVRLFLQVYNTQLYLYDFKTFNLLVATGYRYSRSTLIICSVNVCVDVVLTYMTNVYSVLCSLLLIEIKFLFWFLGKERCDLMHALHSSSKLHQQIQQQRF